MDDDLIPDESTGDVDSGGGYSGVDYSDRLDEIIKLLGDKAEYETVTLESGDLYLSYYIDLGDILVSSLLLLLCLLTVSKMVWEALK